MTLCSRNNFADLDHFTEHMFNLFTSELSHRTGADNSRIGNRVKEVPPTFKQHECSEMCIPIIRDLVSAFLNPGTTNFFIGVRTNVS